MCVPPPHLRTCLCSECCLSYPGGVEKCFGLGCGARRAPALTTLEGKITIAGGAGASPARTAVPKGTQAGGGQWHLCQLPWEQLVFGGRGVKLVVGFGRGPLVMVLWGN